MATSFRNCHFYLQNTLFLHFFAKIFGHVKKKQYLCTRFREISAERAFSSAGLEHLPYKQRVGGSNPSTPTNKATKRETFEPLFCLFVAFPDGSSLTDGNDTDKQSMRNIVTHFVAHVCARSPRRV